MAEASSREQILTLKVMRLTRADLTVPVCIPTDSATEEGQTELLAACAANTGQISLADPLGFSLVLPQSFENIYLGETFTCYVCVHNDSALTVTDVCLKIDLQTTSQRVSIPSKYQEPIQKLEGGGSLGEIVHHEVKEVGQHILVCAVQYASPSGDKLYFRKFFKFPVAKPLDVRTKFYNAESDDVYLEAQIQNTTHVPMVMEKVALEPSDLYKASELNSLEYVGTTSSNVEDVVYLKPQDTHQFLYCLSTKPDVPLKNYRGVTAIGKLDMIWRTSFGERGRLQTSQLQRMAPGYGDLRLTVEEVPSMVKVQEVFQILCRLHNCCDRALDLQLHLESDLQPNLIWLSKSGKHLGEIGANSNRDLELSLLAVSPGLQAISGIRLTDTFLKRTYEHDEIAQVFVTS